MRSSPINSPETHPIIPAPMSEEDVKKEVASIRTSSAIFAAFAGLLSLTAGPVAFIVIVAVGSIAAAVALIAQGVLLYRSNIDPKTKIE